MKPSLFQPLDLSVFHFPDIWNGLVTFWTGLQIEKIFHEVHPHKKLDRDINVAPQLC